MSEVLQVKERHSLGTRNSVRLRRNGQVPAVLYGHGQQSVSLSLPADQFRATLRHGARVVELQGDAQGQALLQEVQWDTFYQHVLHVDLLRIEAGEMVTVTVPLETRGEAPGTHEGGIVELLVHELEIEVSPSDVPEKLQLNVNHLELGQSLTAADIEDLPKGARLLIDVDQVLVQCVSRAEQPLEEEALAAEPEVIGQKSHDEDEESGQS